MNLPKLPRIVIAGSVNSTLRTLSKMVEHKSNIVGVLGLHPDRAKRVSGYVDLAYYAKKYNIPFQYFSKINSDDSYKFVKDLDVDLFFVIGLSQLVREPMLSVAKYGLVGFHPTKLPEGRGRGAVAWLILGKAKGAATFFIIDEGMDSGPILGQHEFNISDNDYAQDVIEKIKLSIDKVLDKILPKLNNGLLVADKQNHNNASYLGQRKPKDGRINWNQKARKIHRLIRATSKPLPGAYTYLKENKIIIHKASVELNIKYYGIPGRILDVKENKFLVSSKNSALWIESYETDNVIDLKIGLDLE